MWGFTTHKRDLSLPTYSLGTSLKSVKCVKDLGIMMLHKSLVHPVIEYAAPALNSYVLARDVLALERIQRRALSACSRAKTWWDGIRRSKWPTLETRRLFLSLVECYWRSFYGMNKLNFGDLFEFTKCNSTLANHPYKLYVKPAKCNPYKHYFPTRIVRDWNSLPGSIVEAGSLSRFMSALKRFLNIH